MEKPKNYKLPKEVKVVRELSAHELKEGDIYSDGKGGKLYRFNGLTRQADIWSYSIFDAQSGSHMGFGGGSSPKGPIYLMKVSEGFLDIQSAPTASSVRSRFRRVFCSPLDRFGRA